MAGYRRRTTWGVMLVSLSRLLLLPDPRRDVCWKCGHPVDMVAFNANGMTAATSEYAMLDSMFAMDPVFPGLGGLDGLDQPMQLDNQFMNQDWGAQNNDINQRPQAQSSTSAPALNDTIHGNSSYPNLAPSISPNQAQSSARMGNSGVDSDYQHSSNTMLTTPPTFDLPNSPWTAWLNNQTSGGVDGNGTNTSSAVTTAAGLLAAGSGKKTMSSSEVYKTVTKP